MFDFCMKLKIDLLFFSIYLIVRCYEQAGLLSKEEKDYQSAVELMDLAAYMYRENGTPDSAAMCLSRAAKYVDLDTLITDN